MDTVLDQHSLEQLIESCKNECSDFKPLIRMLGKVFSSPELLNNSFLYKGEIRPDSPESVIPIDHEEVIQSYNMLLRLEQDRVENSAIENSAIENSIINGINALGNSIEIQLKATNKPLVKHDLNQFAIVLLNPNLHSPGYLESALPNILRAMTMLPIDLQYTLVQYWSKYSSDDLRKILGVLQQMVTLRILDGPHTKTALPVNDDNHITNSVKCIKLVYYASMLGGEFDKEADIIEPGNVDADEPMNISSGSSLLAAEAIAMKESNDDPIDKLLEKLGLDPLKCRKPLICCDDFVNECLNDAIEIDRDFMYYKDGSSIRFSFLNYPFVLNTTTKSLGLFYDNRVRMYSERRMTVLYALMQGQTPSAPYLKLRVRRDHLIQDALVRVSNSNSIYILLWFIQCTQNRSY